jgi:hypothetical protein
MADECVVLVTLDGVAHRRVDGPPTTTGQVCQDSADDSDRPHLRQSPIQIPRSRAVWMVSESRGTVFMTAIASSMRTGTMCGGW